VLTVEGTDYGCKEKTGSSCKTTGIRNLKEDRGMALCLLVL
jgi:hypothetical protein